MALDFTLPITSGGEFTLSQLKKPLVLFFYPRDNTSGCTVENQDFSKLYPEFLTTGYEVLGISRDKHVIHCNFQKKHVSLLGLICHTLKNHLHPLPPFHSKHLL